MTERVKEIVIIMIIILGLFAGACLIAGWMGEDIEAKNIALCPSDETLNIDYGKGLSVRFKEPNESTIKEVIKVNQEIETLEVKIKEKNRILQELCEPNEPIEAQIAERDYRAMKENAK